MTIWSGMRVAPLAMRGAMTVIYAETKFSCRHRYIATADQQHLMFVCDQCQHRTELLPLDRGRVELRIRVRNIGNRGSRSEGAQEVPLLCIYELEPSSSIGMALQVPASRGILRPRLRLF